MQGSSRVRKGSNRVGRASSRVGKASNRVPGSSRVGKPAATDNYLVWAILSTIFCCLPFGIVSITTPPVSGLWFRDVR